MAYNVNDFFRSRKIYVIKGFFSRMDGQVCIIEAFSFLRVPGTNLSEWTISHYCPSVTIMAQQGNSTGFKDSLI
jgi:hypothetical protein